MKIYYDYQIFFHQKYGGISKYLINLVNNLDIEQEKLTNKKSIREYI